MSTRAQRVGVHKRKMADKKIARAELQPGFEPVVNRRVDGAIRSQMIMLMQLQRLSAVDAEQQARANVARGLAAPRMDRFPRIRPSKSDSAAYRKAI